MKEIQPISHTNWEAPSQRQERLKKEGLEATRRAFKLHFTYSALSHMKSDNMKVFTSNPKDVLIPHLPKGVSSDTILGIDPKENKKIKQIKTILYALEGFSETVDRLWGQPALAKTPEERKITTTCEELEQMGKNKETAKNILTEHFKKKLEPQPESITSSPVQIFPKDSVHS